MPDIRQQSGNITSQLYQLSLLLVARMWHRSPSEGTELCSKMVLNRSKYESHTQEFIDLHWLTIRQWIEHKILSSMHNCINKTAPYQPNSLERGSKIQSSISKLLNIPATKRKIFADHSFSVAGPKWWDSLPDCLRLSPTIDKFMKHLKTHLFKQIFNTSITQSNQLG